MEVLKYFKTMVLTAKETGISEKATYEANAAVSRLTSLQIENLKWKAYTAFSDEQRAAIGQYAAAIFQIAQL